MQKQRHSILRPAAAVALLACCSTASLNAADPAAARLTVHADRPGPTVSPTLYGIFFEEINCAGDGGLYAELVRNRSFEDSEKLDHWRLENAGPGRSADVVESKRSEFNARTLKMTVESPGKPLRLINEGYWGIALNKGDAYRLTLESRTEKPVVLIASLEARDGTVYASKRIDCKTPDWTTQELSLKAGATDPAARLVLTLAEPGAVWLDMVSLLPKATWKNRPNGLRPDLAGMLNGLKPTFVRFPGGCWVEGDNMSLAYRWKQTIGSPVTRRTQYNIWQYNSTHGLGYHEYLQMCEDLGAEPLFVINCGMSHREVVPMDQIAPYIQDAIDAIEYANGPVTSTWGALRAKHGHPAPFNLRYLEIGNENGGPAYQERYDAFYRALKATYPEVTLIANEPIKAGNMQIVDEHYYSSPTFFIQNANKYDTYPRNGPKIYVGEYAVTQGCGQGNLAGALGEAAFMTGMERNSDVVVMASYAPLFANVNYKKWNPDLINFDSSRVYGIPSYHVQKLFRENLGNVILPTDVAAAELPQEMARGGIGLGTWNTQSEYRDIKVTHNGQTLLAANPSQGLTGWRSYAGKWQAREGVIAQTGEGDDRRLLTGDANWHDYTLTLQARKLGGAEGFLILFHVKDDANWLWWNIGGWANSQHAIEKCGDGGKGPLGQPVRGSIETGRWYNVRIELAGQDIRCYLDDKLIHEVKDTATIRPLHAVASWSDQAKEAILKVVNVSGSDYPTDVSLNGFSKVKSKGECIVLSSGSGSDENTLDQPLKVAPLSKKLQNVAPEFRHTFPAHSLTVLRIPAQK